MQFSAIHSDSGGWFNCVIHANIVDINPRVTLDSMQDNPSQAKTSH